jgi:hypothetical protein
VAHLRSVVGAPLVSDGSRSGFRACRFRWEVVPASTGGHGALPYAIGGAFPMTAPRTRRVCACSVRATRRSLR